MAKRPRKKKPEPDKPYCHMPSYKAWLEWWAESCFGIKP